MMVDAPSFCLKGAIYHHLPLFKGISMVILKPQLIITILIKAQLKYIATVLVRLTIRDLFA